MNRNSIISKSGKGMREASGATHFLPRDLQRVLGQIDGKSSVGELLNRLAGWSERDLSRVLTGLSRDGFIREVEDFADYLPSPQGSNGLAVDLDFTSPAWRAAMQAAQMRREAEESALRKSEETAQRWALIRSQRRAEAKAKREAEKIARRQAVERFIQEAEEQMKREAAERAAAQAAAKAKHEAAERVRREAAAEERRQREAAEQARQEAEAEAQRLAEEQRQRVAAEQARQRAAAEAQRLAEERRLREAAEQARQNAEAEAQRVAEEQRQREAAERARQEAEAEAQRIAEEQRQRVAAEQARQRAEAEAQRLAEERRQREAAEQARQKAEAEAQRVEEEWQQREAAERAREREAKAKQEAEERRQREAAERARRETENAEKRDAAERLRRLAEEMKRRDIELQQAREAAAEEARREEAARLSREAQASREAAAHAERARQEAAQRAVAKSRMPALQNEGQAKQLASAKVEWLGADKFARRELGPVATADGTREPRRSAAQARKRPAKWGKPVVWGVTWLLLVLLILVHLLPFNWLIPGFERVATAQLDQPVKIRSLHLSLLPKPHWRLDEVVVGANLIRAPRVRMAAELGALLGSNATFSAVEVEAPLVSTKGLVWLLFDKPGAHSVALGHVDVRNATLEAANLDLPAFDVGAEIGADGRWRTIIAKSVDRRLSIELQAAADSLQVIASAKDLALPFAAAPQLTDFRASGSATRSDLDLNAIEGRLLGGSMAGSAKLAWGAVMRLDGELHAQRIEAAQAFPALFEDGRIDMTTTFSVPIGSADRQPIGPQLAGQFSIGRGILNGVDLGSVLKNLGTGARTRFAKLDGEFSLDGGRAELRNLHIYAGPMAAVGVADVDADSKVRGRLAVVLALAGQRHHTNLDLAGTFNPPDGRNIRWLRR